MSLPGTLVNGGIVQHGTTSHQNSGVTPGTYTTPMTITVDSTGVLTAAFKVWQASVTYSNNDFAVGSNSLIYISQQTGNLNHDPATDDGTWWKLWDAAFLYVDGSKPMIGNLDFGGHKGVNLQNPTAAQDAATKAYVDSHSLPSGTDTQTIYNNAGTWSATSLLKTDPANSRVVVGNPATPLSGVELQAWGSGDPTEPALIVAGSASATDPVSVMVYNAGQSKRIDYGMCGGTSEFMTGTVQGDGILRHSGTNPIWIGNRVNSGDVAATAIVRMDSANGVTVGGTTAAGARLDVRAAAGQAAGKFTGASGQKALTVGATTSNNAVPALEISNDTANVLWVRGTASPSSTAGAVVALQTDQYPTSPGHRLGSFNYGTYVGGTPVTTGGLIAQALEVHTSTVRGTEIVVQTVTPTLSSLATRARFGGLAADLKSEGSFAVGQRTVTSGTTTGNSSDAVVYLDATLGNVVYNLPAITNTAGKLLILKRIDSSANAVTLQPNGASLETGATTFGIGPRDSLILSNDGATWFVVAKYDYTSGGGGAFIP